MDEVEKAREKLVREGLLERVYDPFKNEWVYKLTEKGTEEAKKTIRESETIQKILFRMVMDTALTKLYMGLYTMQDVADVARKLRRVMQRIGVNLDEKVAKWLEELDEGDEYGQ